jgi:hypothetical protein
MARLRDLGVLSSESTDLALPLAFGCAFFAYEEELDAEELGQSHESIGGEDVNDRRDLRSVICVFIVSCGGGVLRSSIA